MYEPPKRRKLTKAERQEVYKKCGGHCAYCGCDLAYKDMQVDHVDAVARGGEDNMGNWLPACRPCNYYKSTLSLDDFRECIRRWPMTLARDSVTYRNAVRFGVVQPRPHKVVFYFEREAVHE